MGQHLFRKRLGSCSVPNHYMNQCWLIVNWSLRNKSVKFNPKFERFLSRKCSYKWCLPGSNNFVQASMCECLSCAAEKFIWFTRHLSNGLYIIHINLWNLPSDIWASSSEMSDVSGVFCLHCLSDVVPYSQCWGHATYQWHGIQNIPIILCWSG